jgi:hypothetical protein
MGRVDRFPDGQSSAITHALCRFLCYFSRGSGRGRRSFDVVPCSKFAKHVDLEFSHGPFFSVHEKVLLVVVLEDEVVQRCSCHWVLLSLS